MRLNKQLSICVGISFVMLTAIANIKEGNVRERLSRSYSGLVTTNVSPYSKDVSADSYDLTSNEFKKSYSLEDFIKFSMSSGSSQGLHVKEDDTRFSHLNIQQIVNRDELFSSKESLADYSLRLNKLKRMQKIALYIKDTYSVPLNYSEQIVLSAFVEAKKKDLDPTLVLSVIGVESTFKQHAKSGAGAIGLTQFIPKYHQAKIAKLKDQDVWSIHGNIKVGTEVLKEYMDLSGGNIRSALQRYNGSLGDPSLKYSSKVLAKMTKFNNIDKI
jgi:soluble lytic murein transglycosylase-like protein